MFTWQSLEESVPVDESGAIVTSEGDSWPIVGLWTSHRGSHPIPRSTLTGISQGLTRRGSVYPLPETPCCQRANVTVE